MSEYKHTHCPVCGRDADPEAGYCYYCGASFETSEDVGYEDNDTGNDDNTNDDTDDDAEVDDTDGYTEENYTTHLPDASDDVREENKGASAGCLVALTVLGLLLFMGFWIIRSL